MSSGLVYLRPQPIAYVRAHADIGQASPIAWSNLQAWCERMPNRADLQVSYGLTRASEMPNGKIQCTYEAAFEIPFPGDRTGENGLGVKQLPGGAYMRRRHFGTLSEIDAALFSFKNEDLASSQFQLDENRPAIEIIFCNPCKIMDGEMKADLLLPIAISSNANAA
ncbi:MAG: GyrI-like domain-containing protein [Pseudomonadota bacterium]